MSYFSDPAGFKNLRGLLLSIWGTLFFTELVPAGKRIKFRNRIFIEHFKRIGNMGLSAGRGKNNPDVINTVCYIIC